MLCPPFFFFSYRPLPLSINPPQVPPVGSPQPQFAFCSRRSFSRRNANPAIQGNERQRRKARRRNIRWVRSKQWDFFKIKLCCKTDSWEGRELSMTPKGWRKELIIVVVLVMIGPQRSQIADISEAYITPARVPFRLQSLGKTNKSRQSARIKNAAQDMFTKQGFFFLSPLHDRTVAPPGSL